MFTETAMANVQKGFSWGKVLNIHSIGEYTIVEFDEYEYPGKKLSGKIAFQPYVCGEDINSSYSTLDAAIVAAIAFKHEGHNHEADRYFFKMVK